MGPELATDTKVELLKHLPTRAELIAQLGFAPDKFLLIVDQKLKSAALKSWLRGFSAVYRVRGGEGLKDLQSFPKHVRMIAKLLGSSSPHSLIVVAVGGGTVGDFAGFFASVYKRGIPWVQVPTTFLAAVDSAHGGKTALNLGAHKNQIGSFHQPRAVYVVEELLSTLPEKQCHAALGEFVKMAVLAGGDLFAEMERMEAWNFQSLWRLLPQAVAAKYEVVRRDPFETKGERQHLNLGHTLGHVLETLYGLPHGEAVAMGLSFAVQWSQHRGYLSVDTERRILALLHERLAVPTVERFLARNRRMNRERMVRVLSEDKKMMDARQVRFVFIEDLGRPRRVAVPVESLLTECERQGWLRP